MSRSCSVKGRSSRVALQWMTIKSIFLIRVYKFIAFALKAPIIAEATAMITFKILSQVVFFIREFFSD